MSEKELVAELELAACCGTPPYTPDTLMEIEVSEHSVRAFLPAEYARPRRLTPAEGFAVAASARLLLAVPGSDDDALRRALAKLDAALGSREAVGLDVDAPAHLADRAGGGGERPGARDRLPLGVARRADRRAPWNRCRSSRSTATGISTPTATGPATCGGSGWTASVRRDRSSARPAPVTTRARPLEEMFVPGPGAVEVHLHLGPGARWVPESVPVRAVGRDADGTVTDVVLDVSGMAWFERLLLQLGPSARVAEPPRADRAGGRRRPPGAGPLRGARI